MTRAGAIAVLVALVALAAPGVANAGFAPGSEAIAGGNQFDAEEVALDAAGNISVAYEYARGDGGSDTVELRRFSATGDAAPPITVSAESEKALDAALGVAPSGRALVAWRSGEFGEPSDVRARWVETDGTLGPILTLEEGSFAENVSPVELDAAVDAAGVASVVWRNEAFGDYHLALRRIAPDGALSSLTPDLSGGGVNDLSIAALPSGATLLVWRNGGAWKTVVGPNLEVGPPLQISSGSTARPGLAVDSLGRALVAWRAGLEPWAINGIRLDSTGAVVGSELAIQPSSLAFPGIQVEVSAGADGDFVVSWRRQDGGDELGYTRSVDVDGNLGPAGLPFTDQALGKARGIVAARLSGGVTPAVWSVADSDPFPGTYGRTLDGTGSPAGPIQTLLSRGESNYVASAPGIGLAVFLSRYPTSGATASADLRRFLTPPICVDSSAAIAQGRPTAVSLRCTGAGIEGIRIVEPPRHGEVAGFSPAGPSLVYTPRPGYRGADAFTYALANDGGESNVARGSVEVEPDTVRPRVLSLRLRHGGVKRSSPPQTTYRFELRLSEPGRASVLVEKPLRGVRKGRRCLKPAPGLKGKRCVRYRKVGRVVGPAQSEASPRLTISGKLDRRISAGGRFRATASATDPAGNSSKPLKRTFRFMVKRPNGKRSAR